MNAAFDNKKRAVKHTRTKGPQGTKGSKYSKKFKKKSAPKAKIGKPVFSYFVEGTDTLATKVPCLRDPEATKKDPSQSHLGTWKNPLTGKKCKVTRVRNKVEEPSESQSQT